MVGVVGDVNNVYYGLRENCELQPKLLHTIKSTCPSQSLGKIPGFEVAAAAKSHMV